MPKSYEKYSVFLRKCIGVMRLPVIDKYFSTDSLLRCPSIAIILKRQRNRDLMIFIQLDNEDLPTSGGETGHHTSLSQAVHKNV